MKQGIKERDIHVRGLDIWVVSSKRTLKQIHTFRGSVNLHMLQFEYEDKTRFTYLVADAQCRTYFT